MRTLLVFLTNFLRCRVITGPGGEPYLERYFLFKLPNGITLYLHRFVASDPDRGLHDHPWPASGSLVLAGGYTELRLDGNDVVSRHLKPGRRNALAGDTFHRILLPQDGDAWTLFWHRNKNQSWGFIRQRDDRSWGYLPHDDTQEDGHLNWTQESPSGRVMRQLSLIHI